MKPIISFKQKGDFKKSDRYFKGLKKITEYSFLDKYGRRGVEALRKNTPKDTGLTADSWYYEVYRNSNRVVLSFFNSNVKEDWCNIAVILQYGHATGTGGWVKGVDYINPALKPIFKKIADEAWEEVKNL